MDIDFLKKLNEEQKKAVVHENGPQLIFAGAGSGKTRVITYKIAYLILKKNISPKNILAMTFTNKAANEMKERIEQLIGQSIQDMWIGTFHSICARILRVEGKKLGYTSNFTIYDVSDQDKLIKHILEARNINTKNISPRSVQNKISSLKNKGISPEEFEKTFKKWDEFTRVVLETYYEYEVRLRKNNAMDFDDLLLNTLELLKIPEIQEKYGSRFHYILIDEYQDTNLIQYKIIKRLAEVHRNICVVGDDDQSIYKWRGADVKNILRFVEDFPDHKTYRLEQNYRSTPEILQIANEVIKNNTSRMDKQLWTKLPSSKDKPIILECNDGRDEAEIVLNTIQELKASMGYDYHDFAILYRTNAQSRYFEETLNKKGIPYIIYGGIRFYERKEIKDILAYLKFLVNTNDEISLERIINVPSRRIGEKTFQKLKLLADNEGKFLWDIITNIEQYKDEFRDITGIQEFAKIINKWRSVIHEKNPLEIFDGILMDTKLYEHYEKESKLDYTNRIENIDQLRLSLQEFVDKYENENALLENYLQYVSLLSDVDNPQGNSQGIVLMTIHSAKGLEFPVVFVVGLEENLFPHQLSMEAQEDIEEERRLFYVAVTRSKERLYLSYALNRMRYSGMNERREKSRFLREIPPDLVEVKSTVKRSYNSFSNGNSSTFQTGEWVIHPSYGRGQIVNVEGRGIREKVVIVFEDSTIRTFFISKANLVKE